MPVDPSPIYVNGEEVSAYSVGNGSLQSLVIHGTVVDLFKALDAGFYVSTWENKPAAMTVSRINLWIDDVPFYTYDDLEDAIADEIDGDHWALNGATLWLVVPYVMNDFSNGVKRDEGMLRLTQFIDPQTITFNGVVSNGSESGDILIMDEEPVYKELGSAAINKLLSEKFVVGNEAATFQGLKYIIDGDTTQEEAISTATIIYNKLLSSFEERGIMEKTVPVDMKVYTMNVTVTVEVVKIFNSIFKSAEDLMDKLPKLKVEVEISSCPYHSEKATGYGSKESPIALTKIKGDKNPLIFWGIDAYGPDKSEPSN